MAKKRGASRKKPKVPKNISRRDSSRILSSYDKRKNMLGLNILRFAIIFVISVVLYIIFTKFVYNLILNYLFGIAGILSGAITVALLLIFFGFWIFKIRKR
jgi:hypothetical protein